jgi:hypothetical protein
VFGFRESGLWQHTGYAIDKTAAFSSFSGTSAITGSRLAEAEGIRSIAP